MDFATFLIQCLNALQYGLLLFLVASGLTLIFGIMGVINLAHGSFYMIGAYMAYALAPFVAATFGGGFLRHAGRGHWCCRCCSAMCWSGPSTATSTSASTCSRC
jgi:ABC-type branched-subunit amino acid transport system permease subunit